MSIIGLCFFLKSSTRNSSDLKPADVKAITANILRPLFNLSNNKMRLQLIVQKTHGKWICLWVLFYWNYLHFFFSFTCRKMPKVSSGLRSHSHSLESTSLVQFENNPCQPNSYSIKPPYPTTSASVGSGRVCSPSKAQLIEVELMQDASSAQKAVKKLQSSEIKASRYIRDPLFHQKGQPQRPDSATFSNGKKPRESTKRQSDVKKCRPLPVPNHRSPRSKGKLPGDQQKVVAYDHMSVAQKRKSSSELLTWTSSLSTISKLKCLSHSSCSSFAFWKGENIQHVLT